MRATEKDVAQFLREKAGEFDWIKKASNNAKVLYKELVKRLSAIKSLFPR